MGLIIKNIFEGFNPNTNSTLNNTTFIEAAVSMIKDSCSIGSNNEKIIYNVTINSNHTKFSDYYKFLVKHTNKTYVECCELCLRSYCYIYDYNKVLSECSMWEPQNAGLTGHNDANISRIFFVENSQHISGYYYS